MEATASTSSTLDALTCGPCEAGSRQTVTIYEIPGELAADEGSAAGGTGNGQSCTVTELTEEEAAAFGSSVALARQEAKPMPACSSGGGCMEDKALDEDKALEKDQGEVQAGAQAQEVAEAQAGAQAQAAAEDDGAAEPDQALCAEAGAPAAADGGVEEAPVAEAEAMPIVHGNGGASGDCTPLRGPSPAPQDSPSRAQAPPWQSLLLLTQYFVIRCARHLRAVKASSPMLRRFVLVLLLLPLAAEQPCKDGGSGSSP